MANPLIRKYPKRVNTPQPNKSAGILDDFAVRKNICTKDGTIEHTPVNDNDIINKKYLDDEYSKAQDGTAQGQMSFWDASLGKWVMTETSELFWDDVNKRLGVGTATPDCEVTTSSNSQTCMNVKNTSNSGEVVMQMLDSGYGFIGTISNHPYLFAANNFGWGIVTTEGFFGFGITSPVDRVHVRSISSKTNIARFQGLHPTYNRIIIDGPTDSTSYLSFQENASSKWSMGNDGSNDYFKLGTGGTLTSSTRLTIDTSGNVGIGTSSPDTKLQVVGDFKSGQDTTNYFSLAGDGEVGLHGTARVKDCVWIDAASIRAPLTKSATYISHGLNGAWSFADAVSGNEETISAGTKIPSNMDRSVAPSFKMAWSADGVSPGNCKWQFEYVWRSLNEDTTSVAQETLTVVSTASATANGLVIAEITGIDLPSSTDQCLYFKITRLSADGEDTITDTTELLCICLEYTANKLGEAL